jgi:hypothetical protein
MEFLPGLFSFQPHRGSGPQVLSQEFDFARQVVQASAVLTGDESAFTETDHHFGRLTVTLSTEIIGRTKVVVTATYGLRDYSNEWDDTYEGEIRFCLLVDHGSTGAQPGVARQLIEGQLGGPDHIIVGPRPRPRHTVTLNRPASRYCALLRGFHIAFDPDDDDHHLKVVRAEVEALPGTDSQHVDIAGLIELRDKDTQTDGFLQLPDSPILSCAVYYTLIAE